MNGKQSGAEMMLRSLGLGEVLDMAKKLANEGTLNAILEFAKAANEMRETLKRIEQRLNSLEPGSGSELRGLTPGQFDGLSNEHGTDGILGTGEPSTGSLNGTCGGTDKAN